MFWDNIRIPIQGMIVALLWVPCGGSRLAAGPIQSSDGRVTPIARFGMFELNVNAAELLRQGVRLKIQEQPLRVLQYLCENSGLLVTREELQSHLWPNGTFVDFEHSLNTAIKKLRQTLGDTADNPRFIETVPRRGWKFIAPVEWVGFGVLQSAAHAGMVDGEQPAPLAILKPATLIFAALAIVICAAVFAFWFSHRTNEARSFATLSVTPLTTYPGWEDYGAISPDGQKIAFTWDQGNTGASHIFVKQIGAEEPLPLTTLQGLADFSPVWSPDGAYLAFVRMPQSLDFVDPTAEVMVMPALGGSVRSLTTVHMAARLGNQISPSVSWSPDGKSLAFMDRTPDGQHFAIFELNLETLQRRQMTNPPSSTVGDSYATYSPDGKTIAFVRTTKESADVYSQPVSGGQATRLTTENHVCLMGVAWTEDGKSIIYGGFGLWSVPARGGVGRELVQTSTAVDPSIRGNKVVYSEFLWEENIWSAELSRIRQPGGGTTQPMLEHAGAGELAAKWTKEFASTRSEEGLRFSPDGSKVAFQSTRTGDFEIWVSNPDGSNPLRLTDFKGPLTGSPRWSPDGSTIAFDSRPNGNGDIFVVSPNGGKPRQLTHDSADEVMPSFSHDGKRIYFAWDRGGSWNVYSMPAAGGEPKQITKSGGFTAIESADGKYLYYAKGAAQPGLWRVPVDGGEETEVIPDLQPSLYGYWAPVKDGIYYAAFDQLTTQFTRCSLRFYSFKTEKSEKVATLPLPVFFGAPGIEISPDGKRIFLVMVESHGADLKLAESLH